MIVSRLLRIVKDLTPSQFSDETLMMWISQAENSLLNDVLQVGTEVTPEIDVQTDAVLTVPHPYDKVYLPYVQAQIANAQGETDLYANYMTLYNAYRDEWAAWVLNGINRRSTYYVSAYALALEHGFSGSIEDWLESIKGDKGDGVIIRSSFNSLEELEQAHPTGYLGDYYKVGTATDDYLVYFWDLERGRWEPIELVAGQRKAREYAEQALGYAEEAADCRDDVLACKDAAIAAKDVTLLAKDAAAESASMAAASAESAITSATAADQAKTQAELAKLGAETITETWRASVAGVLQNNALEIDLTQDFASSGRANPVKYLLDNADAYENNALLRLVHNGSVYTARCIHTVPGGDGCQYVEIKFYGDDGFVEQYVYCNGVMVSDIGYAGPVEGGKPPYFNVNAAAKDIAQISGNTEKLSELDSRLSALEGSFNVESWADVQRIVRTGLASRYFAIGDQLQCKRGDKVLNWDVIGIDHDTPADPQWSHSMTLQLHDVDSALQFDGQEALFFAEDGLDAGDYWFFVSEHPWAAGNAGKYFSFTLTQPVPAGGQLVLRAAYAEDLNGSAIDVYENGQAASLSKTAILTMHDSEPTGGTGLGTISAVVNGNCNCMRRALVGSAHYPSSAIRQYLNSDAGKGSVWTPQGKFDRPPNWGKTSAGFLHGADPDFVAALGLVEKTTTQNKVDGGGTEKTTDLVWLPSRAEVYAGYKLADEEGTAYAYYADQSGLTAPGQGEDANRVKYLDGAAKGWLLRTASGSSSAAALDIVGELVAIFAASSAYGVAPCVCIV